MPLNLSQPITYLITSGQTAAAAKDFSPILQQISAAVSAGVNLIQIREKQLTGRSLFELATRAVELTRGTSTRLLINDRADVAVGAGAAGVHLATNSLSASTIRSMFGPDLLIGVSTHSLAEAQAARDEGADFAVFGPVFSPISKTGYAQPHGIDKLAAVVQELRPFPVIALGGMTTANAQKCLDAGAAGIGGISLFADPSSLRL